MLLLIGVIVVLLLIGGSGRTRTHFNPESISEEY